MKNDPLAVLVRPMTEDEKYAALESKLSMRMRHNFFQPDPAKKMAKLTKAWVAWNKKELGGDDFAYLFGKVYHRETLDAWDKAMPKTPIRTPLSEQEKRERRRIAAKKWRDENPDYNYATKKRMRREEAKRRRQGGYAVITHTEPNLS